MVEKITLDFENTSWLGKCDLLGEKKNVVQTQRKNPITFEINCLSVEFLGKSSHLCYVDANQQAVNSLQLQITQVRGPKTTLL